jgi:hypothetical protein
MADLARGLKGVGVTEHAPDEARHAAGIVLHSPQPEPKEHSVYMGHSDIRANFVRALHARRPGALGRWPSAYLGDTAAPARQPRMHRRSLKFAVAPDTRFAKTVLTPSAAADSTVWVSVPLGGDYLPPQWCGSPTARVFRARRPR